MNATPKTSVIVLLIVALLAGACSPKPIKDCDQRIEGYRCFGQADGSDLYIALTAAIPANFKWLPATAIAADQAVKYTAVYKYMGGGMSLIAYLLPVALVVSPNVVRDLAQGPMYLSDGNTIRVIQNGQVREFQIARADEVSQTAQRADIKAQTAECVQKGECSMTPQPTKVVVVIDDDASVAWRLKSLLKPLGFEVIGCLTLAGCAHHDGQIFVVDAQDVDEILVGPAHVRALRAVHPEGFIVGISGNLDMTEGGVTVAVQFTTAGANAVWSKGAGMNTLVDMIRSFMP